MEHILANRVETQPGMGIVEPLTETAKLIYDFELGENIQEGISDPVARPQPNDRGIRRGARAH